MEQKVDDIETEKTPNSAERHSFGKRSVFKELQNDLKLSPAALKGIGVHQKMTPSPSPHATSPTTIKTPVATETATGLTELAAFEANAVHQFPNIEPELEAGLFVTPPLNLGDHTPTNRFSGLTEYDESSIPELSGGLAMNLEEQMLKLPFDDNEDDIDDLLMPIAAGGNTFPKVERTNGNDVANNNVLAVHKGSDTAGSSDNDTFSECQSYRSIVTTEPIELSEFENFCSADDTNNESNSPSSNELNNTMENVPEIIEDNNTQGNNRTHDITFENEPMDLDLSITTDANKLQNTLNTTVDVEDAMDIDLSITTDANMLQYTLNATVDVKDAVDQRNVFGMQTPEPKPTQQEDTSNVMTPQNIKEAQHDNEIDAVAVGAIGIIDEQAAVPESTGYDLEKQQSTNDLSSNKTVDMRSTVEQIKSLESSAAEALTNANDFTPAAVAGILQQTSDTAPVDAQSEEDNNAVMLTNSSGNNMANIATEIMEKYHDHINKNLNSQPSYESGVKSSSSSTQNFPAKETIGFEQFPFSPNANIIEKPMKFLEKSDYADRMNKASNEPLQSPSVEIKPKRAEDLFKCGEIIDLCSPQLDNKPIEKHFTEIIDLCSPDCFVQTPNTLNSTFDSVPTTDVKPTVVDSKSSIERLTFPTATDSSDGLLAKDNINPSTENRRTFNVQVELNEASAKNNINASPDNRRTFNVASEVIEASAEDNINASTEKRRTFNVASEVDEASAKDNLNRSTEIRRTYNVASEINESLTNASPENRRTFNVADANAPNKDLQQNQSFEPMDIDTDDIESFTTPPISPPVPALQKSMQQTKDAEELAIQKSMQKTDVVDHLKPSTEAPIFKSPPVPALQKSIQKTDETGQLKPSTEAPIFKSPPVPALQKSIQKTDEAGQLEPSMEAPIFKSPPVPARQNRNSVPMPNRRSNSPPIRTLQKRPPIHPSVDPFVSTAAAETLSVKEQTKSNAIDEKDFFFASSPFGNNDPMTQQQFSDADFSSNNNLILNPADFEYLFTKGNNHIEEHQRSSLLLRFDPLLGIPVQQKQQQLQYILANNTNLVKTTIEEKEEDQAKQEQEQQQLQLQQQQQPAANKQQSNVVANEGGVKLSERSAEIARTIKENQLQENAALPANYVNMSVDVIKDMNIDTDCKKSYDNSNLNLDEKQNNYKMDEREKKIKNEVLKTEDIEKKLKEAEQREEALIKRITDKDKTIAKMNGVTEAYEKAIAELIAEKEQIVQNFEKELTEAKADRDSNYHHLTSLETTFSDLHVKYEKSKEMTAGLKASEDALLAEKRQNLENLRLQEQRYDKMKNHAMQQLEIANKKLESLTKEHSIESTKLKALLKKEEIACASFNEQLQQKARENAALVKICDELINGQGS